MIEGNDNKEWCKIDKDFEFYPDHAHGQVLYYQSLTQEIYRIVLS